MQCLLLYRKDAKTQSMIGFPLRLCVSAVKESVQLLLIISLLSGCVSKEQNHTNESPQHSNSIKYAGGFNINYDEGNKWVEVSSPYPGATSGYKYLLIQKGDIIPPHESSVTVIEVPVTSIVCTSTTHIPLLDYLDETAALTGFPSLHYISSEKMRKRIDSGKVQELGVDKGMNIERIAMLKPDLVMGYTMTSDLGQFRKIKELNIPVVINAEYLEKHPLGRAEWIKFMAAFFNKERMADSIFNAIEYEYLKTKSHVDSVQHRPTVISGIVYGDAWFLPGGRNYAARMLKDAGCQYLWEQDSSSAFLQLSFESVYEKANHADLWIGVGSFTSLQEIQNADYRYAKFNPFVKGTVYTYDARKGATGGSEFLEIGYLRPDIILKDLVKISHPGLLEDHRLYFHAKLE